MPPTLLIRKRQRGRLPHHFSRKKLPKTNIRAPSCNLNRIERRYSKNKRTLQYDNKHALSRRLDILDPQVIVETPLPTKTHIVQAPSHRLKIKQDRPNSEISAIPNPIPDTGFYPDEGFGYPQLTPMDNIIASTVIVQHAPTISRGFLNPSSFSPLPPLMSVAVTPTAGNISLITAYPDDSFTISSILSPTPSNIEKSADVETQNQKMSSNLIILLSVGSGLILFGIFILIKLCVRPTQRARPTPSLPILEEAYSNDDYFTSRESPLFGGKERISPQPGNADVPWTWVQYPESAIKGTNADPAQHNPNKEVANGYCSLDRSSSQIKKAPFANGKLANIYPFTGFPNTYNGLAHNPTEVPVNQKNLSQKQKVLARGSKRFSVASTTFGTATPLLAHSNFGVAITEGTALTPDGRPTIKKTKSMRRSRSNSFLEVRKTTRDSTFSPGLAYYDGAEVSSPMAETSAVMSMTEKLPVAPVEGRSRIKSAYYNAGSLPRHSKMPSACAITTATKVNLADSAAYERGIQASVFRKSDSHRDRDTNTKALTFALGLTSPPMDYMAVSPQPTIYPEDSPSIMEQKTQKKGNQTSRSSNYSAFSTDKTLGPSVPARNEQTDLLRLDMQGVSHMAMATLSTQNETQLSYGPASKNKKNSNLTRKSDDKPPRVPSPPPLPSLSQMGLKHANPDAFANYRSPTYSIYNLYDGKRKSWVGY